MNSITDLIKREIKRQYKTLTNFSKASGIPYSTLSNALTKGVGGTSFGTVMKICKILNIREACSDERGPDGEPLLCSKECHDLYTMLAALDDRGKHTVTAVLNVEYSRCQDQAAEPPLQTFGKPIPQH